MKSAMQIFMIISTATVIIGCISQSEYDQLQKENENLKSRINEVEQDLINRNEEFEELSQELSESTEKYNKLVNTKKQNQKKSTTSNAGKKYRSEEDALFYVKDWYSFYERDTRYRNVVVRRKSNNSFWISLEICTVEENCSESEFWWKATVRILTINNDGSYNYEYSSSGY